MPIVLRVILIASSLAMLAFVIRKVKKSKMQIEYTVFWVLFGVLLLFISLVPQIVYFFAKLIGIQSPTNLVLAFITVSYTHLDVYKRQDLYREYDPMGENAC